MMYGYDLNSSQKAYLVDSENILSIRRCVVDTSAPGLGKTVQNLALAKSMGMSVLVFCIVSNAETWSEHITNMGVLKSHKSSSVVPYTDLICTGKGDSCKTWIRKVRNVYSPSKSYLDVLCKRTLIIFDEAHTFLKESTKTSAAISCLIDAFSNSKSSARLALLSGTIVHNESKIPKLIKSMGLCTHSIYKYNNSLKRRTYEFGWNQLVYVLNSEGVEIDIEDFGDGDMLDIFERFIVPNYITGTKSYIDLKPVIKNLTLGVPDYLEERFTTYIDTDRSDDGKSITNIHNQSLAKTVNMLKLIRSILLEGKHKIILFASTYSQYNFVLNNLDEDLLTKTRMIIGQEKQIDRHRNINLFQQDDDRVTFLIIHQDTCTGLSLHDTSGNWPRIVFTCPVYRFDTMVQQVYRVCRFGVVTTPRIYIIYDDRLLEKNIHIILCNKGDVQKRVVKYPSDIVYPSQWIFERPEDDSFIRNYMSKIRDLPAIKPRNKTIGDGTDKSTTELYTFIMEEELKLYNRSYIEDE